MLLDVRAAEELVKVPVAMEEAENEFYEKKSQYQSLFKKSIRSTDAWQIFGRSLYYISRDKRTWHDAEDFCLSRGAHLASILSDKEQVSRFSSFPLAVSPSPPSKPPSPAAAWPGPFLSIALLSV
ncbi:C-type lectin domain family 4 member F [Varanus komodoensis]|nr:C-type lectin domain family 4 member F [Varanus komodoensis]